MAAKRRFLAHSDKYVGFLLFFGIIMGHVFQTEQQSKFNCRVDLYWYHDWGHGANGIKCQYINTAEEANRAQLYIANQTPYINKVKFESSDIDQFSNDFILPDNIIEIVFWECEMGEIPNRLITSMCYSLSHVWFSACTTKSKTIRPEMFKNCEKIQEIRITDCGITEVSRNAFSGLRNLQILELYNNEIRSFEGFDGIPNLQELNLNENKISFIEKNAFKGLNNLNKVHFTENKLNTLEAGVFDPFITNKYVKIFLQENPFYCTCSLKWLQDWLKISGGYQHMDESHIPPLCSGPVRGDLRTLNFCNITTESPNLQYSTTPATSILSIFLLIIAIISMALIVWLIVLVRKLETSIKAVRVSDV